MPNPKLAAFFEEKASENSFTPDIAHLTRSFDAVPIFIYGTQQKKFSEASQMDKATFISTARTCRSTHVMYIYSSGGWKEPVVFHLPMLPDVGCILGELYLMPVSALPALDSLMSNGLWVKRTYEHVRYKEYHQTGKIQECVTEAQIYLGDAEYWKKEQEAGRLRRKDRWMSSFGPYYTFQSTDDKENRDIIADAIKRSTQPMATATERRVVM